MHRSLTIYLLCLSMFLLFSCGDFKGRVTDKDGNPVANVYVFLYFNGSWDDVDSSEEPKFTTTDGNGNYEINPGNWDLLTLINDNGVSSYRIIPEYPGKSFDPEYREWDWDDAFTNCSLSGNEGGLTAFAECAASFRTGFDFTMR